MSLPLQDATYRARAVRSAGFGKSAKGNTQLAIELEIVDSEALEGERISWVGHFTDKTAARTIESLQHMGWQGDDLSELAEGCDAAALLPEVVEIVCAPEEYEGDWQLKVKWVNKPGAGRFAFKEPVQGNDLKAFAAQMKATVRSVRGGAGRPAAKPTNGARPAAPQHPNAPGFDDDSPF